ncbi:MAG: type II toxin-antitoxin system HicB family antitoxin [Microcystaceae cyanobacterium]
MITLAPTHSIQQRTVLLSKGEDGYLVAEVPSLPGCISQGKTRQETLDNIKEAIELYIESLIEDGEIIPDDDYEIIKI